MKIYMQTTVNQEYRKVFSKFNSDLFLALNPPFFPVTLDRFDGSKKNDEVHVTLDLLFRKEKWISIITEDGETDNGLYFIDEGKILPFFLKKWRHKHTIIEQGNGSIIIDDVFFETPNIIMNIFFYIFFLFQFLYRKPVYKNYFKIK